MKTLSNTAPDTLERNGKGSMTKNTVSLLLVGNNPYDLAQCCRSLINFRSKKFNIETAFGLEECMKKVSRFKPEAIILDDSVGFMTMIDIKDKLHKDARFMQTPIVIIKNSNYHHATLSDGFTDFILRENVLQGELPQVILNAITLKDKLENCENVRHTSYEKKLTRLFLSIFSSDKVSA